MLCKNTRLCLVLVRVFSNIYLIDKLKSSADSLNAQYAIFGQINPVNLLSSREQAVDTHSLVLMQMHLTSEMLLQYYIDI